HPAHELSRLPGRKRGRDAQSRRSRTRAPAAVTRSGERTMLITDVVTRLVAFPFDAPFHPAWARGRNMPALQMVLIEVHTDEGITGIGAAHAGPEAMIAIDRFVKPYFVGE